MRYLRANPMILLLVVIVAALLLLVQQPERRSPSTRPASGAQTALYHRLQAAGLGGDELATVGALTLGYKQDLQPELRRRFQASGAAHILAVSGLHTGVLYFLLISLLTVGGRLRPMHENIVGRCAIGLSVIAAMWGYAWLTGMTPSVVRCVVMITMVEVGKMCYRRSLSLNTIAAAAVLILICRPEDLWSVSFQLSFAATAAIVVLARWAERYIHRSEWKETLAGKAGAWFVGIIIISLAAQAGTLPLTMYYFKQICNYFLLSNLIVMPISLFLLPFGLLTVALGGTGLGLLIGKATWALAWLMNHAVGWVESLPGSTTAVSITAPMVWLYYALLIAFCMSLYAFQRVKS